MDDPGLQHASLALQRPDSLGSISSLSTPPQRPRSALDEGYSGGSEETRSLSDVDGTMQIDALDTDVAMLRARHSDSAQKCILDLPSHERDDAIISLIRALSDAEKQHIISDLVNSFTKPDDRFTIAIEALAALPTSSLAAVVDRSYHRLHLDPVDHLPPEITELIFLNLTPSDLLRCSTASRKWRERVLDANIWKLMFGREGWVFNSDEVTHSTANEEIARRSAHAALHNSHRRKHDTDVDASASRKKLRESNESTDTGLAFEQPHGWGLQHGPIEADEDSIMGGLDPATPDSARTTSPKVVNYLDQVMPLSPPVHPALFDHATTSPKINWLYLYKQRRRLEENWNIGRYKTFQLPHRDYPTDAHDECVYTIQYSGNYLVSGSRDKTIKVWNLDTQRCERTLSGHHIQSVLCLQFDEKDDIIVSGGSDSYVIIWRFSTGEMLRKMTDAHTESVLNLRFDHRYLITCSKDKTIKIWNRHQINMNDPIIPASAQREIEMAGMNPLKEFSLLTTLQGHGAAVNAIQVYGGQIVSASGDRTIKSWDINTGTCLKTFAGHTKGIACVQYDGRRIVSGSSDNTVRIFDAATSAEVACLAGHTNLVRTVQARFGDLHDSGEELEASARAVDDRFFRARENGLQPHSQQSRAPRNAGSTDPSDICATGAKIPPGGGGSRWSRIVSGSYDETVIIWKKDYDGKWIASRKLHQDEILQNPRDMMQRPPRGTVARVHMAQQDLWNLQQQMALNANGPPPLLQHFQVAHAQLQAVLARAQAALAAANAAQPLNGPQGAGTAQLPAQQPQQHQQQAHQAQQTQQAPAQAPAAAVAPAAPATANTGNVTNAAQATAAANDGTPQHIGHPANAHAIHARMNARDENNRVFKLQFDSRRVVCCSQNRFIVGWDFANGDADLEVSSRFFAETD